LRSRVEQNFVTASGTLTVIALKLKPSENPLGAIAALPRGLVRAFLIIVNGLAGAFRALAPG